MSTPIVPPVVVAVDGPSGSGKSSTARGVAQRLGFAYLDTGAMYRAITWALLERGVDLTDPDAIAKAAGDVVLHPGPTRSPRRSKPTVSTSPAPFAVPT